MAGRDEIAAVERRRSDLAPAFACLTRSPLRWGGGHASGQPFVLFLGEGEPSNLPGGELSIAFSEQLQVRDGEEGKRAVPTAYRYDVGLDGRELLAFHWHPLGASHVRTPHLHVNAEVRVGQGLLGRAHLPTGAVSPVDVLALLLGDLGAPPLRDDWAAVLERSRPE